MHKCPNFLLIRKPFMPTVNNGSTLPGWGDCTCPVTTINPVTGSCGQSMLNNDDFMVNTSNGRNIFTGSYGFYPNAACAPSSSFQSFPSNVTDSFGYFIGVNSIVIKKRSIDLLGNMTTTKLSTIDPYTSLRSDIYTRMVRRFSMVTKRIPRAELVEPFGLCFSNFSNGTQVSIKVPDIELSLQDGKKWIISTANSIKQMTKDVACLAFVDGGPTSEPAIVIGTHQFEDNFLVFDLENWAFGFSSSLIRKQTSCSNFNFTLIEMN
ncbi:hypothetical protein OSB04_un001578 [Centaurea solstitialis]|uniref:Xylanase inhibitor C-terminal domain-containing protein n=1 Tax=Centaurea solstitialis TaxID=347529 RepID=A0AA38S431_9ASTR|nr:hypothetical protein OSB04_un001578 [Centaurea solstitialis]